MHLGNLPTLRAALALAMPLCLSPVPVLAHRPTWRTRAEPEARRDAEPSRATAPLPGASAPVALARPAYVELGPAMRPPWPALAIGGVGVLLLVTGIQLGGAALSTAESVQARGQFDATLDARGRALSGAAIALDVAGGAALAVGAIWGGVWLYHRGREARATALRLTPWGTGAALVGGF